MAKLASPIALSSVEQRVSLLCVRDGGADRESETCTTLAEVWLAVRHTKWHERRGARNTCVPGPVGATILPRSQG